ncbi:MAG TPA: hypothetical protein PLP74_16870, partial [Quisquiliibacterium sp.]|nr:hypothetical protein [Quisquiliibacterium sp.]
HRAGGRRVVRGALAPVRARARKRLIGCERARVSIGVGAPVCRPVPDSPSTGERRRAFIRPVAPVRGIRLNLRRILP